MTKIKPELEKELIEKADQCGSNHACVHDPGWEPCEIELRISDSILFVNCLHEKICPYKKHFGYGYYCTCPCRLEIAKKYKF